jgi:hypothetical protein
MYGKGWLENEKSEDQHDHYEINGGADKDNPVDGP